MLLTLWHRGERRPGSAVEVHRPTSDKYHLNKISMKYASTLIFGDKIWFGVLIL